MNIKPIERGITLFVFIALVLLPAIEVLTRIFGTTGVVASPVLVQHLTLWIGFLGAIVAARRNKLLSLTTHPIFNNQSSIDWPTFMAKVTTVFIVMALAYGSWELVKVEKEYPVDIAPFLSRWFAQLIMPIGFLAVAIHMVMNSYELWRDRGILLVGGIVLTLTVWYVTPLQDSTFFMWVAIIAVLFSLIKGAPIFIGLGGLAILFFWQDWTPLSAIPAEAYRIVVSPTLPTIPLFTLAGYILAESHASERLVKLFRALFGWIPGGTPVVLVLLCGFFTALTGGSGVTILALGGLLMPLLIKEGYSKLFSLGLITVDHLWRHCWRICQSHFFGGNYSGINPNFNDRWMGCVAGKDTSGKKASLKLGGYKIIPMGGKMGSSDSSFYPIWYIWWLHNAG